MTEPVKVEDAKVSSAPVVPQTPAPNVKVPGIPADASNKPVASATVPTFVIRYDDRAAVPTLLKYMQYSKMDANASKDALATISKQIDEVQKWQKTNLPAKK